MAQVQVVVASSAMISVKTALAAVGYTVTRSEVTPGAVGYSTVTIAPKAALRR